MKLAIFVVIVPAIVCSVAASAFDRRSLDPRDDGMSIRGKYFRRSTDAVAPGPLGETQPQFYRQCVDHRFPNCSQSLWNQRYWQKWEYYEPEGPIFFMFGGEDNANGLIDFYFENYAKTYNATLVVLEHRFYGESFPTDNIPPTLDDLQLLTSEQALMDAVVFMHEFKKSHSETIPEVARAKVVSFGGSYPGNLAAWSREKYPEVFNVAVASSAPVQATFDFSNYIETVSRVILDTQPMCFQRIQAAFSCMGKLTKDDTCSDSRVTDKSELPSTMYDCYNYDMNDKGQRMDFFYELENFWSSNAPATVSQNKCLILNSEADMDVVKRYGEFRLDSNQTQADCPNKSRRRNDHQEFLRFVKAKENRDAHSWTWQTCNEFGYFQTPDPELSLFGSNSWDTSIDVERCQSLFPEANFTSEYIQSRVNRTNEVYKGQQFDGTCTIFVNGRYDPWHLLGINHPYDTTANNSAILIEGGEHCDDMVDSDKPAVQAAQAEIEKLIGQYLLNPMCN